MIQFHLGKGRNNNITICATAHLDAKNAILGGRRMRPLFTGLHSDIMSFATNVPRADTKQLNEYWAIPLSALCGAESLTR